jgi:translation initiation factor 3 subunit B
LRGQELAKHIQDRFKQFIWRPRPRTLVTKEQQAQIRKNLRKYSQKFDEEDAAEELADSAEQIAHRKRLIDEWNAWRARTKKDLSEQRGHESQAEKPDQDSDDKEEIEVWIDEVIEQLEEVVAD